MDHGMRSNIGQRRAEKGREGQGLDLGDGLGYLKQRSDKRSASASARGCGCP